MGRSFVFFEGKVEEYEEWPGVGDLPTGAIAHEVGDRIPWVMVLLDHDFGKSYRSLDEHEVPKELRATLLLLT